MSRSHRYLAMRVQDGAVKTFTILKVGKSQPTILPKGGMV